MKTYGLKVHPPVAPKKRVQSRLTGMRKAEDEASVPNAEP
jgi:hypothetical protein